MIDMSVLIRGMKMPQNCSECKLLCNENFEIWCCLTDREDVFLDATPDWCPLVEVPEPHGRLIDVDEICFSMTNGIDQDIAEEAIRESPTVIEAEGE